MSHARLGPSNHRWPNCPGSVREEQNYPNVPSAAAIDGTGSHLLLELCLHHGVSPSSYEGEIIGVNHEDNPNGWMVYPDRIERVQMALDYITRQVTMLKEKYPNDAVTVESESRSDPGGAFGRQDWWGTCDITIMARDPMTGEPHYIEVADYKDGSGYVSEKNNSQLMSYLFGKMRPYIASGPDSVRPFKPGNFDIRMTIIQPKTTPVVRYQCSTIPDHNLTIQDVIEKVEQLAAAAHMTDDPDAPIKPGKWCQWCKANMKRGGHCTAQSNNSLEVMKTMSDNTMTTGSLFEQVQNAITDVKSLSEAQLAELADAEAGIQEVFDRVKKEIEERIDQGITVPGYAMQPGRGRKVWVKDEEEIAAELKKLRLKKAQIYPPKLVSPAQAIKIDSLSKKQKEFIENELIAFKAGSLTLKKVSRNHQPEKLVSEDDQIKMMFADVKQTKNEVSFI